MALLESKALEYTKELMVAMLSNRGDKSLYPDKGNGQQIAECFETIYNKILELQRQ
jgi:hypothetical protein